MCLALLFVITSHVPLVVASICQTNGAQAASLSRLRSDAIVLFVILDDGICHLYLLQTACFMSSFVTQTNRLPFAAMMMSRGGGGGGAQER